MVERFSQKHMIYNQKIIHYGKFDIKENEV